MPQDLSAAVARSLDLGHGHFLLEFVAPPIAAEMGPGQFFMIGIPGANVLLRRPFSVCGLPGTFADAADGAVQVLYKVVGRGTALLSSLRPGAALTALGPLGHGFDVDVAAGVRPLLVAGGIGVAPFPALAAALAARGAPCTLVYGARSVCDLPLLDWFRERCEAVTVTTEDGSLGRGGLVTEALSDLLDRARATRIYACGPSPMLRAVAAIARSRGVPSELSLEAHMACGFGVCLGCVVPTRGGEGGQPAYERVCVEGPVMPAERLLW
jgi:dihydroorotate dehydrogenase electron transfer subunit